MKYLIDTHAFLWAVSAKGKLSELARKQIEDADNEIYVSTASLWEIAIKVSIRKTPLHFVLRVFHFNASGLE